MYLICVKGIKLDLAGALLYDTETHFVAVIVKFDLFCRDTSTLRSKPVFTITRPALPNLPDKSIPTVDRFYFSAYVEPGVISYLIIQGIKPCIRAEGKSFNLQPEAFQKHLPQTSLI